MSNVQVLSGKVQKCFGRKFASMSLPFNRLNEFVKAHTFNVETNKGIQRALKPSHASKLTREIREGNFTPSSITVTTTIKQRKTDGMIKMTDSDFEIRLDKDSPLNLIDGQHRLRATKERVEEIQKALKNPELTDEQKKGLETDLENTINSEFPVTLILDAEGAESRQDFQNLQEGLKIDATHKWAIKARSGDFPELSFAMALAVELNERKGSPIEDYPFYRQIRLDSRGEAGLPAASLSAQGSSDLATSLVGSAKIATHFDLTTDQAAAILVNTVKVVHRGAEKTMQQGKMLSPPTEGGTRGSATMLIGLGNLVLFRCGIEGVKTINDEMEKDIVRTAKKALDEEISGSFTSATKREYIQKAASEFYANSKELPLSKEGVPTDLMGLLSYSTFAVETPKKKRGRKAGSKNAPKVEETATEPTTEQPVVS